MQEQYHYLPALGIALHYFLSPVGQGAPLSTRLGGSKLNRRGAWVDAPVCLLGVVAVAGRFCLDLAFGAFLMSQREREYEQSLLSLWWLTPLLLPLPMGIDASLAAWYRLNQLD